MTATEKTPIFGAPVAELVSASYVERQNLTVRMGVRRYTRLTNAFSKKLENHVAATALHFAHYNFVRRHQTLRVTPAVAAGVSATLWHVDDLLNATDRSGVVKKKLGRPPVPKKLARGALLSVRFSDSERRALEVAADRDGVKLSEWARRTLLAALTER